MSVCLLVIILQTAPLASSAWANQPNAVKAGAVERDEVLAALFGPTAFDHPMPLEISWIVTIRISPAQNEPESQFTITKQADGTVAAELVRLRVPLQQTLVRVGSRYEGVPELARHITLDRWTSGPEDARALRDVAARFEKAPLNAGIENVLVLDSQRYEIWINGGAQKIYATLLGPSGGKTGDPFLQWIEATRKQLNRCLVSK